MEYGNVTYTLVPVPLRRKLQRLQNRALRIIYRHTDRNSLPEMHTIAKLTSLDQRASRQLMCLTYKRAHDLHDYPLLPRTGNMRLNEKMRFNMPRPNSEKFKKFPFYAGSKLWDSLDRSIQELPEYNHFKSRLSKTPDFATYPVT